MNYLINVLFVFSFFTLFGQKFPTTIIFEEDTVIVFSLEQGKELSLINEKGKKCSQDLLIAEKQLILKDTIISVYKDKIEAYRGIESSLENIVNEKNDLIDICKDEKKEIIREVQRQKSQKWIAIFSGVVLTVIGLLI